MIYLIGVAIMAVAGYCIALFLGITRTHILHDIALGWFVGVGYYSVTMFIIVFGAGLAPQPLYSLMIILAPIVVALVRITTYGPHVVQAFRNMRKTYYLPVSRIFSFETILVCYSLFVFILVFVHGASTPTNGDDAIHLRAYSPMLVYANDMSERARIVIAANGIWPSFSTLFFWHLKGGIDHFYINYTILTSFSCFLLLIYLAPAIRGEKRQGLYNVFLVMTLPLFIYHVTTTYADARLIMPFALGFLFFIFYLRDMDVKDFKTLTLFFVITCLVKDKGFVPGVTGLFLSFLYYSYVTMLYRNQSFIRIALYVLTAALLGPYLFLKTGYASNIWDLWEGGIKKISTGSSFTGAYWLFANYIIPVLQGEPVNLPVNSYTIRLLGFFNSMFSSSNFGVIYYIVILSISFNMKRIFKTRLIWELTFLTAVFLEAYFYALDFFWYYQGINTAYHRILMLPAVISCIYLSSLWTKAEGGERDQSRA